MEPNKKIYKELLFALQLGVQVISSFLLAVILGLWLDGYFDTKPIFILVLLLFAFIYTISLLLGVAKNE